MRKSKKSESRNTIEEILEAYLRLCLRIGIENITLQKVADEADLSFTSVYYHFGGKHKTGLADAAAGYVGRKSQENALSALRVANRLPVNPLEVYARSYFDWAERYPAHARFFIYNIYRDSVTQPTGGSMASFLMAGLRRIEGMLDKERSRLALSLLSAKRLRQRAIQIHDLLIGALVLQNTCAESFPKDEQIESVVQGIEALVKFD